jgi:formamidopyrimidine-DNA glycosylase
MPELPDVVVYCESIERRIAGARLEIVRVTSPALLRTVEPAPGDLVGLRAIGVRRMGKRIVLAFERELFCVIHLMVAGRFRWKDGAAAVPRKLGLAVPRKLGLAGFGFETGTLILTEAGTKRRASVHVVRGESALAALDPGGLEVLTCDTAAFGDALRRENHTLKRSLTDPHLFSGIGNAYSDEILHRARLSPVKWSERLTNDEIERLHAATCEVLLEWTARLRTEAERRFPEKVTAFRPEMAVHGRHREPCPACGDPVQRIVYASTETNYCARCQTGGKLLADRALSQLLKKDWPKSVEELEARRAGRPPPARRQSTGARSVPSKGGK